MARVYVSIGSNIEREIHVRSGVQDLDKLFGPLMLSSVYECPSVGFVGANFYNLVTGFDTETPVEELIGTMHEIERSHGRVRRDRRHVPRTLDLDVLIYDDLIRHDKLVDIPRGEILEHAFVLQPLAEIAPKFLHPETRQDMATHWHELRRRTSPLARTEFDPLK